MVAIVAALQHHPPEDCACECGPSVRAPPSSANTCRVQLAGIALSSAKGLKLAVGTKRYAIAGLVVDVELSDDSATARIDDDRFTGSRRLTRTECRDAAVSLTVHPRPARVTFTGVPDDVAVICREGCAADRLDKPHTLATFPAIAMDETEAWIEVELKHPDYRPKTMTARLVPGPNRINVTMTPRCPR